MSEYVGAPIGSVWRCDNKLHPEFIVTAVVLCGPTMKRMSSPPVYQTALYTYVSAFTGDPFVEIYEYFRLGGLHDWQRLA